MGQLRPLRAVQHARLAAQPGTGLGLVSVAALPGGTVEPNAGHRAVAAWQDHAEVSVVTQNVDDLHERAGSSPVHHLHGSLFEFRCATCGLPYAGDLPEMTEPALEVEPPTCDCGGLIRPDIVWFGEPLPEEPWQHAVEATTAADVLVVVGTSGIVYPAAESARVGAGARHGRHRGQSGADAAVRTAPRSPCARRPARRCRHCCSGSRPAELSRPPRLADHELRHRQRHPRRQGPLDSGAVDVESRGEDRIARCGGGYGSYPPASAISSRRPACCNRPRTRRWPHAPDTAARRPAEVAKAVAAELTPGRLTEHSTSEHTTASNGSAAENLSTVASFTTTGTAASAAAARARVTSRCSGSTATTC